MRLFAVTVLYLKTDDTETAAVALIGAPNACEAIAMAAEAVSELPEYLGLIGGDCEELDAQALAALNAPDAPVANAQATAAGATIH